ncbi:MAG: DNA-protecting protein DprA [Armatimonadetes bacterium]|nr:DNA-protecting protein DprA [Armatimonadota bacterium]
MRYPVTFWQHLLSAQLSAKDARVLLEELGRSAIDPISALKTSSVVPSAARERAMKANLTALAAMDREGLLVLEDPPYRMVDPIHFPPALFALGDVSVLERPRVAIVGTRSASTYGLAVAHKFGESLAQAGVTVISGGALGVDAASHEGALNASGLTVAVLPSGVDKIYPPRHRDLCRRIREVGLLVSQFPLGHSPIQTEFQQRNVTIAALADAVLVVEAPEKSGALGTAGAANEQGKPVFVVPGNITMNGFRGSHALIRDGATLVDHPDQILEVLDMDAMPARILPSFTPDQQVIIDLLAMEPLSPDEIGERCGLDPATILAELTTLEMEAMVMRSGVKYQMKP